MMRLSAWFKFMPPRDWSEASEAGRLVYQSPKGEVLIVSTAAIAGHGAEEENKAARDKLLQNALAAAANGAGQTGLKIIRELKIDERIADIDCWTVEAETLDGTALFFQSVFRNGMGVLLATFEGYNSSDAKLQYDQFVRSVAKND